MRKLKTSSADFHREGNYPLSKLRMSYYPNIRIYTFKQKTLKVYQ